MILKKLRQLLGPSIVTGASDDDPSGIATYSQAGAGFGTQFLWTAIVTYPLMVSIQEMCARIGVVSRKGLTGILKSYYPRPILWLMILFSFPAIVLNIAADLAGMGAVCNMLIPSVPSSVFAIVFSFVLLFSLVKLSYRKIARILQFLCLVLLGYLIVPFLGSQNWGSVVKGTLLPNLTFNKEEMAMLVAILGTTISPYLFFWQTSVEVEETNQMHTIVDKSFLSTVKADVRTGMFFTNLIFYFIILTSATELHPKGITDIQTVDQAAAALRPLVGEGAYLLFAFGVIGTGLLAIPVLAGSLSYIFSEAFGWEEGLDKKFHQAKGFYGIMILSVLLALGIDLAGINPVKALIFTAILYGLTAPVLIAIILHISNNKKIMGEFTNNRIANLLGWITLLVMTMAAGLLVWQYLR